MSENTPNQGTQNLVQRAMNTKETWKRVARLPKDMATFDSIEGRQIRERFYDAVIGLNSLNHGLARLYAIAYNGWVDSLPNPCECMYIHSLG